MNRLFFFFFCLIFLLLRTDYAPCKSVPLMALRPNLELMIQDCDRLLTLHNPLMGHFQDFLLQPLYEIGRCQNSSSCSMAFEKLRQGYYSWEEFSLREKHFSSQYLKMASLWSDWEQDIFYSSYSLSTKKESAQILLKRYYLIYSQLVQESLENIFSPIVMGVYFTFKEKILHQGNETLLFRYHKDYDLEWNEFFMKISKELNPYDEQIVSLSKNMHAHWNGILKILYE